MRGNIVYLPTAIGELFDKITILEIKAEYVHDPDSRTNVLMELKLLGDVAREAIGEGDPTLHLLVGELRDVNRRIWASEDAVRSFGRNNDFGPEYLKAARGSYSNNDERARVKREINKLTNSAIIEVKFHSMAVASSDNRERDPSK